VRIDLSIKDLAGRIEALEKNAPEDTPVGRRELAGRLEKLERRVESLDRWRDGDKQLPGDTGEGADDET
jgi:hypothetical protein